MNHDTRFSVYLRIDSALVVLNDQRRVPASVEIAVTIRVKIGQECIAKCGTKESAKLSYSKDCFVVTLILARQPFCP